MAKDFFAHLYSYDASNDTINGTTGGGPFTVTLSGPLAVGDTFHYTAHNGTSFSGTYVGTNPNGDLIFQGSSTPLLLSDVTYHIGDPLVIQSDPFVCFVEGTLIRTPLGDVPVESLRIGDLVVTSSGELRPVKWLGHQAIDCRNHPNPWLVLPVRIAADAFGPSRPSRDLYLSAGHSVCVDLLGEMFIPVGYLVNGATIAKVEVEEIIYWHVELDSHDILIAHNLPAESYLAMGNRGAFEELRGLLPAMLEGRERTHADFCRPVVTEGPVLDFVRQRLMARAEEMGWKRSLDADLRLVADGEIIHPVVEGRDGAAAFVFPASAKDVRLLSNAFSPATFGSDDPRILGVMLCDEIAFADRKVSLGDERLRDGVHQLEDHDGNARRWTNGKLVLDPQFWAGDSGLVSLVVNYDVTTVRGWTAPATVRKTAPVGRPKLRVVG
jgi:hypothetical protein